MSRKTLCESKLDLIAFVAECEDMDVLLRIKEVLDEIEQRDSSNSEDLSQNEILSTD